MDKSAQDKPRLTLDLEGPTITAAKFRKAVDAFFNIIEEVGSEAFGKRKIRWVVKVRGGSAHLNALPEPVASGVSASQVVKVISSGMRAIERRAQRPRFFSDVALENAKTLATIADGRLIRNARISGVGTDKPVDVSKRTASHVETILGAFVRDYGTIEGRLQSLSERGGEHFSIYDSLTDEAVRCFVSPERMEDAWKAFGSRVAVSGMIRYRSKTGKALSIDVEDIEVFPPECDLPTADSVCGILSEA